MCAGRQDELVICLGVYLIVLYVPDSDCLCAGINFYNFLKYPDINIEPLFKAVRCLQSQVIPIRYIAAYIIRQTQFAKETNSPRSNTTISIPSSSLLSLAAADAARDSTDDYSLHLNSPDISFYFYCI